VFAHIHLGREKSEKVMDKSWYWTAFPNIKRLAPEFCKSRSLLRSRGVIGSGSFGSRAMRKEPKSSRLYFPIPSPRIERQN